MKYAFRVEDYKGLLLLDKTMIYFEASIYFINKGAWKLQYETYIVIERCNKLRNIKEKES